jgi:hypothetical protein
VAAVPAAAARAAAGSHLCRLEISVSIETHETRWLRQLFTTH